MLKSYCLEILKTPSRNRSVIAKYDNPDVVGEIHTYIN